MNKFEKTADREAQVLSLLKMLGGKAKTSQVKRAAREFGIEFNVRTYLRKLRNDGYVSTRRPFEPFDLELLWIEIQ